jgi:hypothetical protein
MDLGVALDCIHGYFIHGYKDTKICIRTRIHTDTDTHGYGFIHIRAIA